MAKKEATKESKVLYQKLGDTWYLFTEIQGEVIFTALPKDINPQEKPVEIYEIIEKAKTKVGNIAA
jgi:hypothetical protein